MRIPILISGLIVLLGAFSAKAQYHGAKDGMGIRMAMLNYRWPGIRQDLKALRRIDYTTGLEIEYVRHLGNALNMAFPLRIARAELPGSPSGDYLPATLFSVDILFQLKLFREGNFIYPYLYAGGGLAVEDFSRSTYVAPMGVGLNFRLSRHFYLSVKAGYRKGFADLRDNSDGAAGLLLLLGPKKARSPAAVDRDLDGTPDSADRCPDQPGFVSLSGCPDADNDGVADQDDQCPGEAGLSAFRGCPDTDGDGVPNPEDECDEEAGPVENKGCPYRDSDRDGLTDNVDECPTEPGPSALKGCPDRDGDGIADRNDVCPNVAGPPSTNGCPDTDGDGVIDSEDRCPGTPGPDSPNGCPQITARDRAVLEYARQAVQFDNGNDVLKSMSFAVLDQIVEILRQYPDYRLTISGHTDNAGNDRANQLLSEQRAQACYDYLVSRGISPSRMSYAGYGESRPIADNRYAEGRARNRRIEFEIIAPE